MPTKAINARIKNKIDDYTSWAADIVTLLPGEIALVRTTEQKVDPDSGKTLEYPVILMKVGDLGPDGKTPKNFSELPWVSAKASDVYAWGKLKDPGEIPITVINDTASGSTITNKLLGTWLKEVDDRSSLNNAEIASLKAKVDVTSVSTAISSAINALDPTDTGSGNFVKAVTLANGKIMVAKGTIDTTELPNNIPADKIVVDAATGLDPNASFDNSIGMTLDTWLSSCAAKVAALEIRHPGHTDFEINTLIDNRIGALDVSEPNTSGETTSFIDNISQTDGKIAATKKTIPIANNTTAGIAKLGSPGGAASYETVNTIINTDIPELKSKIAIESANFDNTIKALNYEGPENYGTSAYEFVDTIKQIDGKISATTRTLPVADEENSGITKLGAPEGAATFETVDALVSSTIPEIMSRVASNELELINATNEIIAFITDTIDALNCTSPTVSNEPSFSFIDTVEQVNGKISATKKTLPLASSSVSGITKLGVSDGAATYERVEEVGARTLVATNQISAIEANYVRFNPVTDSLYIGKSGADTVIFDCGGAEPDMEEEIVNVPGVPSLPKV